MEKNFYTDNFEQLLKDSTENFRMYPSKRVWHSIYNDLHPSRKWPSLAIWILLISSVAYIGLSNKSQISNQTVNAKVGGLNMASNIALNSNNTPLIKATQTQPVFASQSNRHNVSLDLNNDNENTGIRERKTVQQPSKLIAGTDLKGDDQKNSIPAANETLLNNEVVNDFHTSAAIASTSSIEKTTTGTIDETENELRSVSDLGKTINNRTQLQPDLNLTDKKETDIKKENSDKKISLIEKNNSNKEWIEDYAFHNKPFNSKWKSHVNYLLYFTPSVGYRILSRKSGLNTFSPSLIATAGSRTTDYKDALSQAAAINMELGGSIIYKIAKKWNLKAGVQLNYTNYAINAYELKHPTVTTITLNDPNTGLPVLDSRSTTLANASGIISKKLNNSTFQVSLPIGADFKLAGRNDLKWYVGATIQPSYIFGGNAYLISSDLKNYVEDKSLMNKWNLNAGIETFVSYKTKSGIIINAGPQFRYQLFSTYSKQYTYDEKLYNVGLKIGIITRF